MRDDPERSQSKTAGFQFVGVGITFCAFTAGGGYLGHWADARWGIGSWAVPAGIVLGAAFGTWDLLRMVAKIDRTEKEERKPK